jgi:flagellar FliL protein
VARERDEEIEVAEKPKKSSKLLMILLIVLGAVILLAVIAGAVLYFIGIPGVMPKLKPEPPAVYVTKDLGEQLVNLADESGGRYLRVKIVLEHIQDEELTKEIDEKIPNLHDVVLRVLRSKTVNDVWSVEQEEKLKKEIITSINKELEHGKIERILFVDFLIQ